MPSPSKPPAPARAPARSRAEKTMAAHDAIVTSALDLFSRHGFAATRMEEIATRAGVAKGTVYLHFETKEALFEAIVRGTVAAAVAGVSAFEPKAGEPTRAFAGRLLGSLLRRLRDGGGAQVLRLLIAEGPRFPRLAEAYYRAVVAPGLALMTSLAHRADARGEPVSEAAQRYPMLIVSPALFGILWGEMFQQFEPLDVQAMIEAQLDLLFGPPERADDRAG